jgi:hypothetical protein
MIRKGIFYTLSAFMTFCAFLNAYAAFFYAYPGSIYRAVLAASVAALLVDAARR